MLKDTTGQKVEIEWHYTPSTYFEERTILVRERYSYVINDGHIIASMTADFFDSQPDLRESQIQELNDYFLGAQPFRKQVFEIQGGAVFRVSPDGRRDSNIVFQPAVMKMSALPIDLVYTDNKGIVHDARRERINFTTRLAELSARHAATDQTALKMLDSYDAAVKDPENELVHLYEVWEALIQKFGNERAARKALGFTRNERSRLGQLANSEPLNQGRHRGRHASSLRDATAEELDEARTITREMIVSYLEHIDA